MNALLRYLLASCIGSIVANPSYAASEDNQLWDLNLEDLMQIRVFSANKKETAILDTAASTYVIRREEIEYSPAKNVPELLRMVPGVTVAQVSASEWAISIRGQADIFSPQLLVLVDGRTVYDPFFGGVRWESEMPALELIERIEVIRGSGGALWGANATNGIINIITRETDSKEKTRFIVQGGNDTEEASIYYNGVAETFNWRLAAQFSGYDESSVDQLSPFSLKTNTEGNDQYYRRYFNGRADGSIGQNKWNINVGYNDTDVHAELTESNPSGPFVFDLIDGYHYSESFFIQGQFHQPLGNEEQRSIQVSYTDFERDDLDLFYEYHVLDFDFQQSTNLSYNHQLLWGSNVRIQETKTEADRIVALTPDDRHFNVVSAFIQDEMSLLNNKVKVTTGLKLEHHKFTGTEYLPSIRALWHINEYHTLWGAVTRAIREPTPWNLDRNIFAVFRVDPTLGPVSFENVPGDELEAEKVVSSELGLRGTIRDVVGYDISFFYKDYEDGAGGTQLPPEFQAPGTQGPSVFVSPVPRNVIATPAGNNKNFSDYGGEIALIWQHCHHSTIKASYSFIRFNADDDVSGVRVPENQYTIEGTRAITDNIRGYLSYRYVDEVETIAGIPTDSYEQLDARVDWTVSSNLKLAFIAKNLIDDHEEWLVGNRTRPDPLEFDRSFALRADFSF